MNDKMMSCFCDRTSQVASSSDIQLLLSISIPPPLISHICAHDMAQLGCIQGKA